MKQTEKKTTDTNIYRKRILTQIQMRTADVEKGHLTQTEEEENME